mgnify:CR=1 FL=1
MLLDCFYFLFVFSLLHNDKKDAYSEISIIREKSSEEYKASPSGATKDIETASIGIIKIKKY